MAFEVTNTGNLPIESMKLLIQWLDKKGNVIAENPLNVNSFVSILRGERRIVYGTWKIIGTDLSDYAGYRVVVSEVN
ncbi:hypothetical protein V6R21_17935 [Limibacter armeniacum]|uniref:hypothetical protein n=1 Tax=Limibacter armeniacum TaxID=466084 RepID=UPI002FE510DC